MSVPLARNIVWRWLLIFLWAVLELGSVQAANAFKSSNGQIDPCPPWSSIFAEAMALLSLNYDVLGEIVAQTDPQSALKLSMVSRKAYDLSIPQALSKVTLSRSQHQVATFCQFVMADTINRLPYLRDLVIEQSAFGVAKQIEFQRSVDFSASSELADLLLHAHRLKSVSIACFEALIAHEPRVGMAICALPALVEIGLHNCGHASISLLSKLRSSPRKLSFTCIFNRKLPTLFHRLVSLTDVETLELTNLDLSDGSQPHAEIHEIPYMPLIRTLSLKGCSARMSLFVQAMPNLHTLRISDVYTKVEESSDHLKGCCWTHLAHVRGNVPDFRHWKVACPIRRLQLDMTAYHYDDVLDIIQRCTPVVLSLAVETKVSVAFWERLVVAAPRLRYLEICLDEGKVAKLHWWTKHVVPVLASMRIMAVAVCVRQTHWPGPHHERSDPRHEVNLRMVREKLMDSIHSLKFISTAPDAKGEDPFESTSAIPRWWWVKEFGGSKTLQTVSADEHTRLRDQLLCLDHNSAGA